MSIFFEELKELIEEINVLILVFRLGHNDTGKKISTQDRKEYEKKTPK